MKKLTPIQIECYERNCICFNCEYKEYNEKCRVKYSLIEYIKKYGNEGLKEFISEE